MNNAIRGLVTSSSQRTEQLDDHRAFSSRHRRGGVLHSHSARARTPHLERNGIAHADCAQRAESSLTVRDTMPVRRDCR